MSEQYQATLAYLYQFVNFEHKRMTEYAPEDISLDRPAELLRRLGDPHRAYPTIHIAGTKGKGSVAAMCAAALRAAGLCVGLYTSPHLQEFRERIRVLTPSEADGRIPEEEVVSLVARLKPLAAEIQELTWFEMVTVLGFCYFARQEVDLAVVEVGMGGRLDATNVITPLVSVITSLSLDHTLVLGDTLAEIAEKKGGIIKRGVPVVTPIQPPEASERLAVIAAAEEAPLFTVGRDWEFQGRPADPTQFGGRQSITMSRAPAWAAISQALIRAGRPLALALAGRFQQENAVLALAALDLIRSHFPALDVEAVTEGFAGVSWPGRLQTLHRLSGTPTLVADGAHNVDSAVKLVASLQEDFNHDRLWLVIGLTGDKDMTGILSALLPQAAGAILTRSSHPRAASPGRLQELAATLGFEAQAVGDIGQAVRAAWAAAGPGDLICVTGSLFVVADLLNQWETLQSQLTYL